jgi:regulatory protein
LKEAPDTPAELKARALRHLARREHSRLELQRKLAPYAESAELLQGVLGELEGRKLLSDHRFAESRAHVLSRKYGTSRIRQDLKSRGVASEIVDRLSAGGDLERARAILARKYRFPADSREELARRARFLQARGFSYDVISRLILKVDADSDSGSIP